MKKPIGWGWLIIGCFALAGGSVEAAIFLFGDHPMRGIWSPFVAAFIGSCFCGGFRLLAASRLTRGFGMTMKAVGIGCVLYPIGAYFHYVRVSMNLIEMGAWFVFGFVLLSLGDDIMEKPAAPKIPGDIYGDPQMMATAAELHHALKSKSKAFDPSFTD